MDVNFLQTFHGEFRWLVALVIVVALIRYGLGWWRGLTYMGLDRGLLAAVNAVLGIQFLLGLTLLIWKAALGAFAAYQIGHVVLMLLAVAAPGIASARGRRTSDDAARFRLNTLTLAAVALLVYLGVLALPNASWALG